MIVGYNDQLLGTKLYAEITAFASVRVYCNMCHTASKQPWKFSGYIILQMYNDYKY